MLSRATRDLALRFMKAPTAPPDPPSGSHGSIQIYRASPRYLTYRLLGFWILMGLLWLGWGVLVVAGFVVLYTVFGSLLGKVLSLPPLRIRTKADDLG